MKVLIDVLLVVSAVLSFAFIFVSAMYLLRDIPFSNWTHVELALMSYATLMLSFLLNALRGQK